MAVDDGVWGTRVAEACVYFWFKNQYPDHETVVDVNLYPSTMMYLTRILVEVNGEHIYVSFETEHELFDRYSYRVPDEVKTHPMLLLG